MDKIAALSDSQEWLGLQIVQDLPGRGRGVVSTKEFATNEVVCDYSGDLLNHKEGKQKYDATPDNSMGFMFAFKYRGASYWCDATEERPGPGRLINHSRCHANVSGPYSLLITHVMNNFLHAVAAVRISRFICVCLSIYIRYCVEIKQLETMRSSPYCVSMSSVLHIRRLSI